jgi:uncharacterized membrane protein
MTTTPTQSGTGAQNATLNAYEDKVRAQLQEATAKLDQLNAKAKEKQAQAELDVVRRLNTTKQNIEKKLKDLKTTSDVQVSSAKADIDSDVASFKSSINELAGKIKVALCIAALVTAAMMGAVRLHAATTSQTLLFAVYEGQNTAAQNLKTMIQAQRKTGERIQSYAVISKDPKGKVSVIDQRRTDASVGAVLGAVVGLVGGPVGAAVGATAGGAVGYLTGDAVGIPRENVENMEKSLTPNSSALIVVLDDRWVNDVQRDMEQANARQVIASQIRPQTTGTTGK